MQSTFTSLGSVASTSFYGTNCSGVYMVRAAQSVTTGSATYVNLSRGAFYPNPYQ